MTVIDAQRAPLEEAPKTELHERMQDVFVWASETPGQYGAEGFVFAEITPLQGMQMDEYLLDHFEIEDPSQLHSLPGETDPSRVSKEIGLVRFGHDIIALARVQHADDAKTITYEAWKFTRPGYELLREAESNGSLSGVAMSLAEGGYSARELIGGATATDVSELAAQQASDGLLSSSRLAL